MNNESKIQDIDFQNAIDEANESTETRTFSGFSLEIRNMFWLNKPMNTWSSDEHRYYSEILNNPINPITLE